MLKPAGWLRVALASLVALMAISLAFVAVAPTAPVGDRIPPGLVLAIAKVALLAFVSYRIRGGDAYAMQWSSMLILLFVAEGAVRAASDPLPSAAFGFVEAVVASIFFVAVLAILRPLKRASRTPPGAP